MPTLILLSILNLWIIPSAGEAVTRKAVFECLAQLRNQPRPKAFALNACVAQRGIPLLFPLK
jgi:hypothetical protein